MQGLHIIAMIIVDLYSAYSNVEGGRAYGLNFHLDRLIGSAAKAEIEAVPWSKEELRLVLRCQQIILDTWPLSASIPSRRRHP